MRCVVAYPSIMSRRFLLLCYVLALRLCVGSSIDVPLLNLTVKGMDLFEMKRQDLHFEFDGSFVDTMDIVKYLNVQTPDTRRLLTGVSRSVRLAKVKLVQALQTAIMDETYQPTTTETSMDGLTYRFSYVYGPHGMLGQRVSESTTNVCIVGPVSLQLTYAIATFDPYSRITYFIPQPTQEDYKLLLVYLNYADEHKQERIVLMEKELSDHLNEQRFVRDNLCDIVHIRDTSFLDMAQVEELVQLSNAVKAAGREGEEIRISTAVVWERRVPAQCSNNFYFNGGANITIEGANAVHSEFCYEQYAVRNNLLLYQHHCENNGQAEQHSSGGRSICWDFTARTDLYARFDPVTYNNGLLAQIMRFDLHDPVEVYVGTAMLSTQPAAASVGAAPVPSDVAAAAQCDTTADGSCTSSHVISNGSIDRSAVTIFVTYSNRVFDDTAFGIQKVLHSIGYVNTCVMGDFDLNMYRLLKAGVDHNNCRLFDTDRYIHDNAALLAEAEAEEDRKHAGRSGRKGERVLLQIAIGPHEPTVFSAHYIAFQVEHPWSIFFNAAKSEYIKLFADALSVWCFSDYHKNYMVNTHGFAADKIYIVPLYTSIQAVPDLPYHVLQQRANDAGILFADVDIAFSGTHSYRREAIIVDIYSRCQADRLHCKFLCGDWNNLDYGAQRHISVIQSKVILNVHTEEHSSLEVHRINHLLALSKCVVTERSFHDAVTDSKYEGAVLFADNAAQMYELAHYYATNHTARTEIEARAYLKYLQIHSDTAAMEASIEAAVRKIVSQTK